MRHVLAALAMMAAVPAQAFDIDFALVMERHAATAEDIGPGMREVVLPGPVRVRETRVSTGELEYSALDDSPYGAAGCMFDVLVDLSAGLRLCPDALEPDEAERLGAALDRSAAFVAANTVPAVPSDRIADLLEARVAERAARYEAEGFACPGAEDADPMALAFLRSAATARFGDMQYQLHLVPRLPVSRPCR